MKQFIKQRQSIHICDKNEEKKTSYLKQYLVTFSASLMAVNSGIAMGWIGPTLPKLLLNSSPIGIASHEISWLVSLLEVGSFFGIILATFSVNYVGRQKTLLFSIIPMFGCVIFYVTSTNIEMLYVGRILSGVTVGASRSVILLYISEIASPEIRGTLSSITFIQLNLGLLLEFIIGSYVPIQLNSYLLLVVPCLFVITFIWMPESPYFFLMKGQMTKARKSMEILRNTDNVDAELQELEVFVKKDQNHRQGVLDLIRNQNNRKMLIIVFGLITLIRLSGVGIITSYVQLIFKEVETLTSPELNSIIVVSSVFLSSWICVFYIDTWGRKPLFLISCIGVAISLFSIGLYFYLKLINFIYLNYLSYLPIIAFICFKLFESIGIGPISHFIITELFSTNIKAMAICVSRLFQSIVLFGTIQLYQFIVARYNLHIMFWFFAIFACFSGIFLLIFLPETKNKSLSEIQETLAKDNK